MSKEKQSDAINTRKDNRFNRPRRKQAGEVGDLPDLKLKYEKKPGMKRHWVNDDDRGRVHQLTREKDYEFVQDSKGNNVKRRVGTKEDGSTLYAYLVEEPQEWFNEDRAEKEALRKEQEQARIKGTDEKGTVGEDGRYVPTFMKNRIEHNAIIE